MTWIGDLAFDFRFQSSLRAYAHWDGEAAVAFVTQCAEQALEHSLVVETAFLHAYDRAYQAIDRDFDLPDRAINLLILWIRQNNGRLSERRKGAEELRSLAPPQIARIEAIVEDCFGLAGSTDPEAIDQ